MVIGYFLEFMLESKRGLIQQCQVGVDVPDMLSGIQAALLQGADVLFVGEIRDLDVLQACLRTAEAGRLVVTQLHQQTPESALRRVIDLQTEDTRPVFRRMLAETLRGIMAQCLLPMADGSRRVAAYGVLIPDDEMRQAIADGRNFMDRTLPFPTGCQRLTDDIIRLRDEGTVTSQVAEEAIKAFG